MRKADTSANWLPSRCPLDDDFDAAAELDDCLQQLATRRPRGKNSIF